MPSRRILECLFSQKPYFGPALCALQGVPKRHAYLQAVVEFLSKERPADFIKILEVGSWAGGSAVTWAKAVQKCFGVGQIVCVDNWQPYFDTKINTAPVYLTMNEVAANGSIYSLFLHNIRTSGVGDMISPLIGTSREVLPSLKKHDFSIVYLDASHRFEDIREDIRLSVDLVEEGGIICGDDLELQSFEVGSNKLSEDVASDKDYVRSQSNDIFYHPGVTRAVAEEFGEVSSWEGFWAMRKTSRGWAKVDLSKSKIEIPEHISTAESYPPTPSEDRRRLIYSITQIAEQLSNEEPKSSIAAEDKAQLLGSYCGFDIIEFKRHYYAVRYSLGEIDWSLSESDLATRYSEADLFRCADRGALIYRIGLNELLDYVEELSSVVAESMLREHAVGKRLLERCAFEKGLNLKLNSLTERVSAIAPEAAPQPRLLEEDYRGFNLIAFAGKVWAAAIADGPVDFHDVLTRKQRLAEDRLLEALSVEGARAAVDRLYDRRALEADTSRVNSRIDSVASDILLSVDQRLCEFEQRVAQQISASDSGTLKRWIQRMQRLFGIDSIFHRKGADNRSTSGEEQQQ